MIKGLTTVARVASEEAFTQLAELLQTLGFEPGKGWTDSTGKGAAFLAPLGNLELAIGYPETQPTLMVEVTQLDEVHAAVQSWTSAHPSPATNLSAPAPTHWNSRLFTLQLTGDLTVGFWQSENPLHNRPIAIEGDLSAAGKRFAIVVARWNAVITDRLLQGSLDALTRSGCAHKRHSDRPRSRRLGDPLGRANPRGNQGLCGYYHARRTPPRRNRTLRSHLQRGSPRHRAIATGDGHPPRVRRPHLRDARTGAGPGWAKGWKQRV